MPRWLWLWSPPALLAVIYAGRAWSRPFYDVWIMSEHGLVELLTPALALVGFVYGVRCLRDRQPLPRRWLKVWLLMVTLGSFYFAGEELSWGQQLFGWRSPEVFQEINRQHETNLHNISGWFGEKPRQALELWVLVGGIVLPIRRVIRGERYARDDWRLWFWPESLCLPAALLAILIEFPEYARNWFGAPPLPLEIRYSEVQELFLAYVLMLFLMCTWQRLK